MLHFLHIIEFLVSVIGRFQPLSRLRYRLELIVVLALALVLNLDSGSDFPGWPVALILLVVAVCVFPILVRESHLIFQGALSLAVVIFAHILFGGLTRPILCVGFLHFITFAFDLATFIVALTYPPYTTDNCATNPYKGCQILKAAIGLDGVLWLAIIL